MIPTLPLVGGGRVGEKRGHTMDDVTRKAVTQRLASAAGHVKGIERMVEDDTYCIDVIKQIQAVQAALSAAGTPVCPPHHRGS